MEILRSGVLPPTTLVAVCPVCRAVAEARPWEVKHDAAGPHTICVTRGCPNKRLVYHEKAKPHLPEGGT